MIKPLVDSVISNPRKFLRGVTRVTLSRPLRRYKYSESLFRFNSPPPNKSTKLPSDPKILLVTLRMNQYGETFVVISV